MSVAGLEGDALGIVVLTVPSSSVASLSDLAAAWPAAAAAGGGSKKSPSPGAPPSAADPLSAACLCSCCCLDTQSRYAWRRGGTKLAGWTPETMTRPLPWLEIWAAPTVRSTRCSGDELRLLPPPLALGGAVPSSGAAPPGDEAGDDARPRVDWARCEPSRCRVSETCCPEAPCVPPGESGNTALLVALSFDGAGVALDPCLPARYVGVCGGLLPSRLPVRLRPRSCCLLSVAVRCPPGEAREPVPGRWGVDGAALAPPL
jgi:hypothetical protein